jgi:hypothetical protein
MLMLVALDRPTAASFSPASDVNVSKLPKMRSVTLRSQDMFALMCALRAIMPPRDGPVNYALISAYMEWYWGVSIGRNVRLSRCCGHLRRSNCSLGDNHHALGE